jgi:sterol desaturase/sphingolipid hydroxylase (fatty acid hydroxylase superfamily)
MKNDATSILKNSAPYIGLDWFILDVLGSSLIFILIEKLFPLYKKQSIFREEWQTDLVYFTINHLLIGFMFLAVNFFIRGLFGNFANSRIQVTIGSIPFVPQVLLCMLAADLVEYWAHRAYHEIPFLWKIHAVHHSAKAMDWIAGSRLHICEILVTRVCIMGTIFALGFSKSVVDAYIIIVGFQAVFIHANVSLPWGPLKYIFVTPDFHHWHHSSDTEALDKNYASHFSFIDYIFRTQVKSNNRLPEKYGVVGDYMPHGYLKQLAFPFFGKTKE